MPNYFYTDPLAAAWMSKHFGMKFRCDWMDIGDQEPVYYDTDPLTILQIPPEQRNHCQYKIYIHPDSLHMLHGQVGDWIETQTENYGKIYKDFKQVADVDEDYVSIHRENDWAHGDYKIIQRNGIAFMWPEVEA